MTQLNSILPTSNALHKIKIIMQYFSKLIDSRFHAHINYPSEDQYSLITYSQLWTKKRGCGKYVWNQLKAITKDAVEIFFS